MKTFVILRRCGFEDPQDLEKAAGRSRETAEADELKGKVAWIRSYVLEEHGNDKGDVGTVCIYQATDADTLWKHAKLAGLPCDEVIEVADTVVVRPDPE